MRVLADLSTTSQAEIDRFAQDRAVPMTAAELQEQHRLLSSIARRIEFEDPHEYGPDTARWVVEPRREPIRDRMLSAQVPVRSIPKPKAPAKKPRPHSGVWHRHGPNPLSDLNLGGWKRV